MLRQRPRQLQRRNRLLTTNSPGSSRKKNRRDRENAKTNLRKSKHVSKSSKPAIKKSMKQWFSRISVQTWQNVHDSVKRKQQSWKNLKDYMKNGKNLRNAGSSLFLYFNIFFSIIRSILNQNISRLKVQSFWHKSQVDIDNLLCYFA